MFEFLFKYPADVYRSGELLLATSVPAAWWWAGSLAAIVVLAASARIGRRSSALSRLQKLVLGGLQLLLLAALALLLAKPSLQIEQVQPGINTVVVMVDDSRSMQFPHDQSVSRMALARALAADLTATLESSVEVQLVSFGASAQRRQSLDELTGEATESALLDSLRDVLVANQASALAGVVVISDGADNQVEAATAGLPGLEVPVHTLGLGETRLHSEIILEDLLLPVDVPVRSQVEATLAIRHAQEGRAVVRVLERGRLVTAATVDLPAAQELVHTSVSFDSGSAGLRDLTFEVVAETGDTLPENNRLTRLLTVSEHKRAVLYLEGEPRWEYKFIRRALAADEVVILKSLLKTTDRKSYRQGVSGPAELSEGLPPDRATLFAYDLIVLGSLAAAELSAEQHQLLHDFVSVRGGSLLVLAGHNALGDGLWQGTPLEGMLPVSLVASGGYGPRQGQAQVTAAGALSAITALPSGEGGDAWQTLPALADYQPLGALKPGATALLNFVDSQTGQVLPLLVTQPYGLGSVALLATASTWRWQTRTPETDPRHQRFWRQLTRQLAEQAPRPVEVSIAAGADQLQLRLMLRDAGFDPLPATGVRASLTAPDGNESRLALQATGLSGEYLARAPDRVEGVHRIDVNLADGSSYTRFARVGGDDREFRQPLQNVDLLQRIARHSGGSYWTPETAPGIASALNYSSAGVLERHLLPLWDMPAIFLVLLLLKVAEWLLRRHWKRI